MVELMGAGYVVDYCVTRFIQREKEKQYRTYMADVLMTINNNLARAFGGNMVTVKYADLNKPVATRSGDDIAVDVMKAAGLTFVEE